MVVLSSLREGLASKNAEKAEFLAATESAQLGLLIDGLEVLASQQASIANDVASLRAHTESLERRLAESGGSRLESIETDLATVTKQVDTVVKALKVGNRVRRHAMIAASPKTPEMRRDRAFATLQRKVRRFHKNTSKPGVRFAAEQQEPEEEETRPARNDADEAAPAPRPSPVEVPPPPDKEEEEAPQQQQPQEEQLAQHAAFCSPRLQRSKPSESALTDLDDLLDDGTTTAKLMDLEQEMRRRFEALEMRGPEVVVVKEEPPASARSRGGGDGQNGSSKSFAEDFDEEVVRRMVSQVATDTALEVVTREMKKNLEGGTSTLELRRDVNAVTVFADEMQKRCEKALLDADATVALARKAKSEEAAARAACVKMLRQVKRAAESGSNINNNNNGYVRFVASVAERALDALVVEGNNNNNNNAHEEMKPSTMLALRVFASALDGGLDDPRLGDEPFGEGGTMSWHEAIDKGIGCVTRLLDRHASPSLALLDVARLRAEFNCLPRPTGGKSRFALEANNQEEDDNDDANRRSIRWRVSDRASDVLRAASGVDSFFFFAQSSDLSECLRVLRDDSRRSGAELAALRGAALDAQQRATSLDSAVQELVRQIQNGFASKADFDSVRRSLARLGDQMRSTTNDVESHRVDSTEYADQLAALSERISAVSTRTPDLGRIERLLARKADVNDMLDLKDRLDDVTLDHDQQQLLDADVYGTIVTKCLACNRPFGDQSFFPPRALPPPVVPPGALATPGARVPSVMPPAGTGVVVADGGSAVEMRPTYREEQRMLLPNVAAGPPRNKSPTKKTMALQFDGVQDSGVVIGRAGASGRLMPLATKRAHYS